MLCRTAAPRGTTVWCKALAGRFLHTALVVVAADAAQPGCTVRL